MFHKSLHLFLYISPLYVLGFLFKNKLKCAFSPQQLISFTADMEGAGASLDVQGAAAAAAPSLFGHKPNSAKPVSALLEEAAQLKTEGNAFYKDKNIRSAIGRYHRALLLLRSIDSDVTTSVKGFGPETPVLTPEQEALLRNTQVDCYNNLAGR